MMQVNVTGGKIGQKELDGYVARANSKYHLTPRTFSRIRRITGYLVGDMDRWNDAKTAEEKDRVKHV